MVSVLRPAGLRTDERPRLTTYDATEPEHSAGGVVIRGEEVVVIIPVKRDADGNRVLGLPKGHLDGDETAAQAAAREVREEAGITAGLQTPLGELRYTYQRRGRTIEKRVEFFLFAYESGDPADHDDEIEQAFWMPLEEALDALTYPGERDVIARAMSLRQPDL